MKELFKLIEGILNLTIEIVLFYFGMMYKDKSMICWISPPHICVLNALIDIL